MKKVALLLAGGKGTGLWPMSRENRPKQFLNINSKDTMLEKTLERIEPLFKENSWIITTEELNDCIDLYTHDFKEKYPQVKVINEPCGRNTAPAIIWAAEMCKREHGEDVVLFICPTDNIVSDESAFQDVMKRSIEIASEKKLVLMGVEPDSISSDFGYIQVDVKEIKENKLCKVNRFCEKPDYDEAKLFVESSDFLWNSGIYAFHVGTLLKECNRYCPDIIERLQEVDVFDKSQLEDIYCHFNSKSIDYALLEKSDKLHVIPADLGWSDVGSWKSVYKSSIKDEFGNVLDEKSLAVDTKNSFVFSEDKTVALVGVDNIAVVNVDDSIMVCNLDESHKIKDMVNKLKELDRKETNYNNIGVRPWGTYHVLEEGFGYKIKRIKVNPKHKLSLQMHYHRSEHWIVVKGVAKIVNGDKEIIVHANESTYIPATFKHRLENPGVVPLEIIEVQCGMYLEEDDIVRFEDDYNRL